MQMKIQIPDEFELGPHTYNIIRVPEMTLREGLLGQHITNQRVIRLQPNVVDANHPNSEYMQTFYHEKVHAILAVMGEDELNNNEKFVDLFATLLLQTDKSAKWSDEG